MLNGWDGLVTCVAVVFISAGVNKIAAVAEEVKNPERNLLLAMLITLAIAALIYVCMSITMAGSVSANAGMSEAACKGTTAQSTPQRSRSAARPWRSPVALGALTMVAMANAGLLASSRFPFSMARDQLLPKALGEVRSQFPTPIPAILPTSGAMPLVILTLDVAKIAKPPAASTSSSSWRSTSA